MQDETLIKNLYNFYNNQKIKIDYKDLAIFCSKIKNNQIDYNLKNEIYNNTKNKLLSYRNKFIKFKEVINSRDNMLKEEYKLNILRNLPIKKDMLIILCLILYSLGEIPDYSIFYNLNLIYLMDYVTKEDESVFIENYKSFIRNYNITNINDVVIKNNEYKSDEEIISEFKNGTISIDDIRNGITIDEQKKLQLYKYGELLTYKNIKNYLELNNKKDLSDRTIWAAKEVGDGLGYDILSFLDYINEYLFEVKSTFDNYGKSKGIIEDSFVMTNNELNVLNQNIDSYSVARVFANQRDESNILYLHYLGNEYDEFVGQDTEGYKRTYSFNNKYDNKYRKKYEFKPY